MRRFALLIVVAIAVATAGAIALSSGSDATGGPGVVVTQDPARTFAPEIVMADRERHFPIAADTFVERSTLHFANDDVCGYGTIAAGHFALRKTPQKVPQLSAERLGDTEGPYAYAAQVASPTCRTGLRYTSTEQTSPYDRSGRPSGLATANGFYLDLLTDSYHGQRPTPSARGLEIDGVPAYYDLQHERVGDDDGLRITYWMLYGVALPPGAWADTDPWTHEGGWEQVSVLLRRGGHRDEYQPESVHFSVRGRARDIEPGEVTWVNGAGRKGVTRATHPVAYATLGGHALYPAPGSYSYPYQAPDGTPRTLHERAIDCRGCPTWSTWRRLSRVANQPWYRYGGAWGTVGDSVGTSGTPGPEPFGTTPAQRAAVQRCRDEVLGKSQILNGMYTPRETRALQLRCDEASGLSVEEIDATAKAMCFKITEDRVPHGSFAFVQSRRICHAMK